MTTEDNRLPPNLLRAARSENLTPRTYLEAMLKAHGTKVSAAEAAFVSVRTFSDWCKRVGVTGELRYVPD